MRRASGRRRPRVLLLHYTGPPVVGGVEAVLGRHARLLAREGLDVHVLVGRGAPPGHGITFHRRALLDSRHPRVLAATRELASGRVPPAFPALAARIRDALLDYLAGIDVCVVHNALTLHKNLALTAALHELAARGSPARIVAWCHDLAWTNPQYRMDLHPGPPWSLLRTPIRDGVYVTVSRARQRALGALLHLPRDAIEVIPNGIDPGAFLHLTEAGRWLAQALRLWEQEIVLLLPARVTRRKQIEYALRVVAEMVRRRVAVRLVVTGPPGAHTPGNREYLEELRALRRRLGLNGQVALCAELPGPRGRGLALSDRAMADLYQMSDALFLPSRDEGFGLPLLEAGLARLPAFTTDLAALNEIGGGAIQTFAPSDPPERVAARILRTVTGEHRYRLRRRVLAAYTWEGIMRERVIPLLCRRAAGGP